MLNAGEVTPLERDCLTFLAWQNSMTYFLLCEQAAARPAGYVT